MKKRKITTDYANEKCQCNVVTKMINGSYHGDYIGNLYRLNELEKQGILELYAGDSPIDDVRMHVEKEDRYTISHYYKCTVCKNIFHIGFCCRGGYNFKVIDYDITKTDFNHIFSGKDKLGTYFRKTID